MKIVYCEDVLSEALTKIEEAHRHGKPISHLEVNRMEWDALKASVEEMSYPLDTYSSAPFVPYLHPALLFGVKVVVKEE